MKKTKKLQLIDVNSFEYINALNIAKEDTDKQIKNNYDKLIFYHLSLKIIEYKTPFHACFKASGKYDIHQIKVKLYGMLIDKFGNIFNNIEHVSIYSSDLNNNDFKLIFEKK